MLQIEPDGSASHMLNPRILSSVKRMTSGRERSMLESALAEALLTLSSADSITLYKMQATPDDTQVWKVVEASTTGTRLFDNGFSAPETIVSIGSLPLLASCRDSGTTQVEGPHTVIPITAPNGQAFGFIDLVGKPLNLTQVVASSEIRAIFENILALLEYSETDTLTGLLNRKTFDEYLTRILLSLSAGDSARHQSLSGPRRRRPHKDGQEHWLGVVDIDHFKRINDGYGHSIGDEVLILLASMMKSSFRTYDKLFRFGGEEFVVLLKPTEFENALLVFERFRETVANRVFPLVGQVTVSIGFAGIKASDQATAIFDRADEALYWSKGNGRNRVGNYENLLQQGALRKKDDQGKMELL